MKWKAISAALLCSCVATPIFAQDAPPPAAPPQAGATVKGESGDIIVTAQRRNERLRDVPISITALDKTVLEKTGATNTIDIARITPGLQMTQYGLEVQPSIRGISSTGAGVGNATNVAVYVDGVFQPNSSSELVDLPDVDQVEVLKGPQGTLYGQNAAGGAIIIHTLDPSFTTTGKMSASYGNFNDMAFRGYVSGPISDTLAVGLAGSYEDKDAFRYNIAKDERGPGLKSRLIRGKILFKPTSNFSSLLTAYYSYRKDWDIFEGVPVGPGTPLGYVVSDAFSIPIPRAHGPNETAINRDAFNQTKTWGVSLLNRWQTGIGELSTTTAYTKFTQVVQSDVDYTAVNLGFAIPDFVNKTFIQEVNFVSKRFSGLQLSAGAFYMNSNESYTPFQVFYGNIPPPLTQYPDVPPPDFTLGVIGYNKKQSWAIYGEANYDVTPKLNISVGGRYSAETQHVGSIQYVTVLPPPGTTPEADLRGPFHFSKFTPRATIRYALTDRSNVYASYSQGFKSGWVSNGDAVTPQCLNAVPPIMPCTGNPPVKPESVTAYEIGYKGRVTSSLNVELAVFHYDWKNIQVFFYNPPTGFFQNAASARINGVEANVNLRATHELSFSGGLSYLDAKYAHYPKAAAYEPDPVNGGYEQVAINADGVQLPRTPKWAGNVAVNYDVMTGSGEFTAYVSVAYQSRVLFDSAGITGSAAHTTVNGELGFSPAFAPGMRFVLWGKNLTNAHYIISNLQTAYVLGGTYSAPRQFGGRLEFKF